VPNKSAPRDASFESSWLVGTADIRPVDRAVQLLAEHGAIGGLLNGRALVDGDTARLPVRDDVLMNAQTFCQRSSAPGDFNGFFKCVHGSSQSRGVMTTLW
jgi:hypothetical protein